MNVELYSAASNKAKQKHKNKRIKEKNQIKVAYISRLEFGTKLQREVP